VTSQEKYATDKLNQVLAVMNHFDEKGVQETLVMLEQLRAEVMAILASATTEYSRSQLSQIIVAIDNAVLRFRDRYAAQLSTLQDQGFNLGVQLVDAPQATLHVGLPFLSQQTLEISKNFSADLVRNVSEATRAILTSEVRGGILSGRTLDQVMYRIGQNIDSGKFMGIKQRAETITRTETNRIMASSTWARLKQSQVPGLKQQWDATNDARTRPAHHEIDGQIREIGQPFDVGGEELRFPGDPQGSAANTINCRCRVVPYSENWGKVTEAISEAYILPHEHAVRRKRVPP
jgi:SPP1 gp7 family putative phage head morphogenesis protein